MTSRFVNPFAFVPLPEEVVRREPTWHAGQPPTGTAADLLAGSITVRWTLVTPLLLPDAHAKEGWIDAKGRVRVPGSSLRGATRSLHETLFAGCLRIVDEDFVPSYRMPARADQETTWQLGRVSTTDKGMATAVQLCAIDESWVDARELSRRWPKGSVPTSGDIVRVEGLTTRSPLDRDEIRRVDRVEVIRRAEGAKEAPTTAKGQILLVTDTAARKKYRDDRSVSQAFWALGTLTDADPVPVSRIAQEDFKSACSGSDDRRRLEQRKPGAGRDSDWRHRTLHADVAWWSGDGRSKPVVARRAKASGFLFPGDAVWVKVEGDHVVGIRLAQIWRHRLPQALTVGQRLGARSATSPHPCVPEQGHAKLCLSCAIFGAIDDKGDDRGRGRQTAYRGHVRFSAAQSTRPVTLSRVDLAPMGTPNPGSGMFYLRMPAKLPEREVGDVATHWGSEADPGAAINGRKYYWHGNPDEQAQLWSDRLGEPVPPRYESTAEQRRSRDGGQSRMTRQGVLVPTDTVLEATVTFDRLDEVGLRSLVAALDPSRILGVAAAGESSDYAVHLGGGKPLGLGSARVEIMSITAHRLAERYLGADGGATTTIDWQKIGRPEVIALVHRVGKFLGGLKPLSRLLDLKGLGEWEPYISYPPGDEWERVTGADFRRSFGFFLAANGEVLAGGTRPWHPLPRPATGVDPSLPIVKRRSGGRR